jgi:hypothetical protein
MSEDWERLWNASTGKSESQGGLNVADINAFLQRYSKSGAGQEPSRSRSDLDIMLQRSLESLPEAVMHRPEVRGSARIDDIFTMDPNNPVDAQIINDTIERFMDPTEIAKIYKTMPTTKINRHSFTLLSRNTADSRFLYQLRSSDGTLFYAYRSLSECGMLRLCSTLFNGYNKGFDYVQTSLLHPALQEFINKSEHLVPNIKFTCRNQPTSYVSFGAPHMMHSFTEHCQPRELVHPTLYALTVCNTTNCNVALKDELGRSVINRSQVEPILSELGRLETILGQKVSSRTLSTEALVSGISEYLSDRFNYLDKTLVANLGYNMVLSKATINTGDVYYYLIQDKISGEKLKLLVMEYTFNGEPHRIIMSVIPDAAGMTKIGTYDKYYPAGILAYKPLDYVAQCRATDKCFIGRAGHGGYYFIGDILEKMWPLTL